MLIVIKELSEIYKSKHFFDLHEISLGKKKISFLIQGGKYISFNRMLEYFVYDMDQKARNDSDFSEKLIKDVINIKKDFKFYAFGDGEIFKAFPEYFKNNNYRVLELDFITNVLEIDYSKYLSFNDYTATLKKKRRYKVTKVINDDHLELVKCESELDFESFAKMHIEQWASKGDPSVLCDTKWLAFYKEAYLSGLLSLHKLMKNDGEVLAYHLGFILDNVYHYLMPTYSSNSTIESPGFALLVKLIEFNFENQSIRCFSLGSGDYSYKRWLSNNSRPLFMIEIKYSPLKYLVKSFIRWVKVFIRTLQKSLVSSLSR